jgi:predicted nucleotidyltransferase
MNLTDPAAAVLPPLRARVLTVLARSDAGLTGRGVATLAEGSVAGVAKVLEALVSGGLVHRADAGSAGLFTLNRAHLAAPAVEVLAGMRNELFARLRGAVVEFTTPPVSAVVFGSAARGDGSDDSDVDLLLVRPPGVEDDDEEWAGDVERLGRSVLDWTGNALNVVEYGAGEVATSAPRPLMDAVESEGVLVHGVDLRTLRSR